MSFLVVDNLAFDILQFGVRTPILRGVSLELEKGGQLGIVGESGSGKTMTARTIMRFLPAGAEPPTGRVILEGEDLLTMSYGQYYDKIRGRKIAMIMQDARGALNPVFPIGKQLRDVYRRVHGKDKDRERTCVQDMLRRVMLPNPDWIGRAYPHELSGGMCQRVIIAMALTCSPLLLISDEPTTGLDMTIQAQILRLIKEITIERAMSHIFISHDLEAVEYMCDRIAVMYCGKVVEMAEAQQLLERPKHPYTKGLVGCLTAPDDKRVPYIPGATPNLRSLPKGCAFVDRCLDAMPICREEEPPLLRFQDGSMVACHAIRKEDYDRGGEAWSTAGGHRSH